MSLISKQLRAFMAVVNYGSISTAAFKLSLTASPVCRMISELENYYNVTLFNRNGRGLTPTEEGRKLYKSLLPIYNEINDIENSYRKHKKNDFSTIVIYYDWGNEPVIKKIQSIAINLFPEQSFELMPFDTLNLTQGEEKNAIYLISGNKDNERDFVHLKMIPDKLKLVRSGMLRNNKSNINLILCTRQRVNRNIMRYVETLTSEGLYESVKYVGSSEIMHEMILDGQGVGIVPERYSQLSTWSEAYFFDDNRNSVFYYETNIYHTLNDSSKCKALKIINNL
ncbi:LysR family transcriptional regulator [Enterobacter roggenkampii]|uniref:LysR family transcriptional regulator n=1 Tax=Enterobacter roggenkampii TaxID=1812935 RepID=UPI002FF72034